MRMSAASWLIFEPAPWYCCVPSAYPRGRYTSFADTPKQLRSGMSLSQSTSDKHRVVMQYRNSATLRQAFNQLRRAYQQRRLTAILPNLSPKSTRAGAAQAVRQLQGWGLIAHCEPGQRASGLRVYLRYVGGRPAARIHVFFAKRTQTHVLSISVLAQVARAQAGAHLIIATTRGWLSVDECLRFRCGGVLVAAVYAG
jgi:hypothetical protein